MSTNAPAPHVAEAPAQYGVVPQGQVLIDSGLPELVPTEYGGTADGE